MHIIHVASEMAPVAKVGGLGDVVLGLSRTLSTFPEHEVEVFLPHYRTLVKEEIEYEEEASFSLSLPSLGMQSGQAWKAKVRGVSTVFFDIKENPLFDRESIYGHEDDQKQFLFFCMLVLHYLVEKRKALPEILHLHDWHTALLALLVDHLPDPKPKTILTIHNMQHQGIGPSSLLQRVCPQFPKEQKEVNCLQQGIIHAKQVVTVSPTYSKEVLEKEKGCGLEETLCKVKWKFSGILNGIDEVSWNPQTDPLLSKNYSSDDALFLEKKNALKKEIQQQFQLHSNADCPLFVCITRLDHQKGIDLIEKMISFFADQINPEAHFVLLGLPCLPAEEDPFYRLQSQFATNRQVGIYLASNEVLAHQLYAAANYCVVPSRFEPCGLTQMIALRYGALPIVRKTGGLADTVFDIDDPHLSPLQKNGWLFHNMDWEELEALLRRTIDFWYTSPKSWQQFSKKGMMTDLSWNRSVLKYLALYNGVVS